MVGPRLFKFNDPFHSRSWLFALGKDDYANCAIIRPVLSVPKTKTKMGRMEKKKKERIGRPAKENANSYVFIRLSLALQSGTYIPLGDTTGNVRQRVKNPGKRRRKALPLCGFVDTGILNSRFVISQNL